MWLLAVFSSASSVEAEEVVTYEAFGAVGDGVHDDLPAICEARVCQCPWIARQDKARCDVPSWQQGATAIIATDTDWNTSRFTIDDTEVENHRKSLFEVRSLLKPETLKIIGSAGPEPNGCAAGARLYVTVTNSKIKRFIRRGLNQNSGTSQRDSFILRRDGSIEGDIDWDYKTSVVLKPARWRRNRLSCVVAFSRPSRIRWSRRLATTTGPETSTSLVPTRKWTA